MTINQILIPKLIVDFVITEFEVKDIFGNLVELSYSTNSKIRELLEIRVDTKNKF
jgi:hypothetical protein